MRVPYQAREEDLNGPDLTETALKTWLPLWVLGGLYLLLLFLFSVTDAAAVWPQNDFFRFGPYLLLLMGTVLGVAFTQSRVSFLCLLLGILAWLIHHFSFDTVEPVRGECTIFLATIYLPTLAALFYSLHEQGVLTRHGLIRLAILLSTILVVSLIPFSSLTSAPISSSSIALFRPVSGWLQISLLGVILFAGCAPVLFFRHRHESPLLGPMILVSLCYAFTAMNFAGNGWKSGQEQAIFITFITGASLALVWAIMESSWRNANMDELTELPNRRALRHHLHRLEGTYALAILDLDHFKKINDTHGHDTGDQALRYVASALRRSASGVAYRQGGEEFVLIYERMDFDLVREDLERVREAIRGRDFIIRGADRPRKRPKTPARATNGYRDRTLRITVSIGVADREEDRPTPDEVLEAADKAMYRAKAAGRDRVMIA
jgi:GGDEF domain-containing protein